MHLPFSRCIAASSLNISAPLQTCLIISIYVISIFARLRVISFIPGGGFPSDRNRKGNSDGQPPIPPAAEGRVVPNLAVTSGHLGTNNYLEHTACLVKSPRLKPGLSDTSSAVSETPGRSGAKFGVSGREYNHTTLLFKYCIFLICLLDEAVWSYCWDVNQTCAMLSVWFEAWLPIATLTQCFQDLSNSDRGCTFNKYLSFLCYNIFPITYFSECDKTVNKEMVTIVFTKKSCQIFFPEIPCDKKDVVSNSLGWSGLLILYTELVFISSPLPQVSQSKRLRRYPLYPLGNYSPNPGKPVQLSIHFSDLSLHLHFSRMKRSEVLAAKEMEVIKTSWNFNTK